MYNFGPVINHILAVDGLHNRDQNISNFKVFQVLFMLWHE